MKISELKSTLITFSWKGRRWYRGAYIPMYMQYEIHTCTGDRTKLVSPNMEINESTLKIQF